MLSLVYNDRAIARAILDDLDSAPIPDLHKAMFRWVGRFTRRSWEMTDADLEPLREAGAEDKDIAMWAQAASMQTWWTAMADGGGVPMDGGVETGPAVRHTRDWYHGAEEGLLSGAPEAAASTDGVTGGAAWIAEDESSPEYRQAAAAAGERYGVVPNLFRAASLWPVGLRRLRHALELLERPQSESLSPRSHALARSRIAALNRGHWAEPTLREQLRRAGGDDALYDQVTGEWRAEDWDEEDRVVLEFAIKATRNTYKVTAADAERFREAGLGDEAYIDVLNTAAIQTSLDRLANSLGVAVDEKPLLPAD